MLISNSRLNSFKKADSALGGQTAFQLYRAPSPATQPVAWDVLQRRQHKAAVPTESEFESSNKISDLVVAEGVSECRTVVCCVTLSSYDVKGSHRQHLSSELSDQFVSLFC